VERYQLIILEDKNGGNHEECCRKVNEVSPIDSHYQGGEKKKANLAKRLKKAGKGKKGGFTRRAPLIRGRRANPCCSFPGEEGSG